MATDVWRSARLRFAGQLGQVEPARGRGETERVETAPGETAPVETARDETPRGETPPVETARGETARGEAARGEAARGETAHGEAGRVGLAVSGISGARTAEREPGQRPRDRPRPRPRSRRTCLQHNIAHDGGTQHITLSGDVNVDRESGARGER
ncbi:hypothetical protein ACIA6D_16300 [Streptomyces cacaoi]